jgi:hypothetical protein
MTSIFRYPSTSALGKCQLEGDSLVPKISSLTIFSICPMNFTCSDFTIKLLRPWAKIMVDIFNPINVRNTGSISLGRQTHLHVAHTL